MAELRCNSITKGTQSIFLSQFSERSQSLWEMALNLFFSSQLPERSQSIARAHFVTFVLCFSSLKIRDFLVQSSSLILDYSLFFCYSCLHFVKLSMKFSFSFLQFCLLLLDSQNKFLSHLLLPFMKTCKMTFSSHCVGFCKTAWFSILSTFLKTHLFESVLSIKLVMTGVRCVDQVLHVCPDKHFSKSSKVTMVFIFNLNHTPWILSSSNILVANLY